VAIWLKVEVASLTEDRADTQIEAAMVIVLVLASRVVVVDLHRGIYQPTALPVVGDPV
jgi:hypothetical protein